MMQTGKPRGSKIDFRRVDPAELTADERCRAEEARRRADNLARSSRALIAAARSDVEGFDTQAKWYVATCRHGQEQAITEELAALGIAAWCPLRQMRKRRRRGEKASLYAVPVFHGYLFLRLMPASESWVGALVASRLGGYIGRDGVPYALPEKLVKGLKLNVDRKPDKDEDLPVAIGDRVDITTGPFLGFQATVRRLIPKHWRAEVDIHIFGRLSHVQLELDQIRR